MKLQYRKQENDTYQTIYDILKQEWKLSNRCILKIKQADQIQLNNQPARTWFPIKTGDCIEAIIDVEQIQENIVATPMLLNILYEDEAFLILDKPAGIPVHPSMSHYETSLANGVQYYFQQCNVRIGIHPVNRLDKNTSGIVVFAKNAYIQEQCIRQMQAGTFQKEYWAICEGILEVQEGSINAPIARKQGSIIEREVNKEKGAKAITHYQVEKVLYIEEKPYSLVRCQLETGRTHQIRVHFAHIGHPLVGDDLYGSTSNLSDRQALHACSIRFIHPLYKQEMHIISELPEDLQKMRSLL